MRKIWRVRRERQYRVSKREIVRHSIIMEECHRGPRTEETQNAVQANCIPLS